ncbi:hypothetical protein C0J52_04122 [Blattella germanica]|nr:hypothetical protein C0J52_04122 [Blattella germanica]
MYELELERKSRQQQQQQQQQQAERDVKSPLQDDDTIYSPLHYHFFIINKRFRGQKIIDVICLKWDITKHSERFLKVGHSGKQLKLVDMGISAVTGTSVCASMS